MSDRMTPIPFPHLMHWILEEKKRGSVFAVRRPFLADKGKTLPLFSEKLETPFGPAAGPHTQLAQNLIAAYYAGARFFELKTVQTLDGEDLPVSKPCILAEDECYNCEWSTELYVPQAFDEYVKAWYAIKLLSREFGLGDADGFVFNMSVGYDYEGITSEKIDSFIEGLKDASQTPVFQACRAWAKENLHLFAHVDDAYVDSICPHVCTSITLSTLHGCPPQEIERIASYLISQKKLHTFVKCNPTILGYDFARRTLDALGYGYVTFDEHHFLEDLQYGDAVPMFRRLLALADSNGVSFGLKLSNTFPVDVTRSELPSEEMYMSGRSLYPLTMEMARRMSAEFDGKLRLSFSGGIDAMNIAELYQAGIWPITLATTLLKPGGYQRLTQMAEELYRLPYAPFAGVSVGAVERLALEARVSPRNRKPVKPQPTRKLDRKTPLTDCFLAPCGEGCPIHQDIPAYLELLGKGDAAGALAVITEKNPLPFITGTICAHRCMEKCTRHFYEEPIRIRAAKLAAAQAGYGDVMAALSATEKDAGVRVAVVGGGAAGIAAAYFLARGHAAVTLFEKREKLGGIVRYVIPAFRIGDEAIDKDAAMMQKLGVDVRLHTEAPSADALFAEGFTHVVYAVGAWKHGTLRLEGGEAHNVIDFLAACKANEFANAGRSVVVIGGGNSAMDAARAAKRLSGVRDVRIVYRRTAQYMPADEEEMQQAIDEGVIFCELLSPVSLADGQLLCRKMVLGQPDASGRRSPVATEETVSLPCDTLVAAVGEKVDDALFAANGVALDAQGRVITNGTLGTSRENVYVIGDAQRGPATVVEAIADAATAASAILGRPIAHDTQPDAARADCFDKQGVLCEYSCAEKEADRCLACSVVCECCVQVCPNRANVEIVVPGLMHPQIIHMDRLCNECGNCTAFCPYDSAPYREKLTLFGKESEFAASQNPGFYYAGGKTFQVRLSDGQIRHLDLDAEQGEDPQIRRLLLAILTDYSHLLY